MSAHTQKRSDAAAQATVAHHTQQKQEAQVALHSAAASAAAPKSAAAEATAASRGQDTHAIAAASPKNGGGDAALEDLWRHVETSWLRDSAAHSSDAWVWQSGDRASLLPLSGAVPFNGEPPLSDLSEHIITPTKLHHVRNHGPVPRIDEQSYRLQVCVEEGRPEKNEDGSVKEPPVRVMREWSMEELRKLPMQSRLVTLTCNGVRRKELNQLEHTKGFSNGPGSSGNSLWSGATLVELLRRSGITQAQAEKYAFVLIDGLDKPSKGHYCTSLPRAYALDPCHDVMVVWQQNGEPLRPDHGAPLRLLVPGHVGARSIKWLGRLCLSQEESRNHYHHADNKLAPSAVSLSEWNSGRWYSHSELILYEQLVNSVISYPAHEEWIQLDSSHPGATRIPLRGIASAGGGRRVLRVEVSADGGNSWLPCELTYSDVHHMTEQQQQQQSHQPPSSKGEGKEEDQNKAAAEAKQQKKPQQSGGEGAKKEEKKGGKDASDAQKKAYDAALHRVLSERVKCWSWTFWHAELPAWQLMTPGAKEIMVRACDEAYNSQSSDLRWNALGMMNNSFYRVRVETRMPRGVDGPTFLRFQHPVQPGAAVGGWQKPLGAPAAGLVSNSLPRVGPPLGLAAHRAHKLISPEEVAKHQSADDCWLVMDETVYDVSPYMKDHPGGGDALLAAIHVPPAQLSALFKTIHAADAYEITGRFAIGVLAPQQLIDALTAYHGNSLQRHARGADGALVQSNPRFFLGSLHPDETDARMKGAKLSLSSSKEMRDEAHRRPNWQELPDPAMLHPRSGAALFPSPSGGRTFLLHSTKWSSIRLLAVKEITHDTKIYTFGSSNGAFNAVGLATGQHLLLAARIGDEQVVRPYTPIWPVSMEEEEAEPEEAKTRSGGESPKKGRRAIAETPAAKDRPAEAKFELLIKIYRRQGIMPGGRLTSYLDTLTPDTQDAVLRVKGPTGHVLYLGDGYFNIHGESTRVTRVNLIGGGTGITPLWQLLRVMLSSGMESEHRPGVQVSLVFANKSEADILMRSELEEQMSANTHRARLVHVLSSAAPPKESVPQQQMQNWHTRAMRISRQLSPRAAAASDDEHSGGHGKSRSTSPPSSPPHSPSSPPSNVRVEAGHVNAFVFRRHLFPPATGTLTFVCGPPPMVSATFTHLLALGFADEHIVEF